MPINPALKPLYPPDWPEISDRVRFERAHGRCEGCGRPHGAWTYQLPDGRWRVLGDQDEGWWDGQGKPADTPPLLMGDRFRIVQVQLGCAHRNHWPADVGEENLAAWCRRCHLAYDRPHHWFSFRTRLAIGDLFTGLYR